MSVYLEIQSVHAREILDSRGNPTVEAEVFVKHSGEGRLYSGGGGSLRRQHGKIRGSGAPGRGKALSGAWSAAGSEKCQ